MGKDVRGIDEPDVLAQEYLYEICNAIENHPRSQQTRIGPSELGTTCTRNLLHKLNGDKEPVRDIPWLPTIGTAVHAWLSEVFIAANNENRTNPRYLVETKVRVGDIAGQSVTGHADLFDTESNAVNDWKIVGATTLRDARKNGPKPTYRTQIHSYGRGFVNAGRKVETVMITYLPRNSTTLNDRFVWSEPYDETVAVKALDRCTALKGLIDTAGIDAALSLYPECGGVDFCAWCPPKPGKPVDPDNPFGK